MTSPLGGLGRFLLLHKIILAAPATILVLGSIVLARIDDPGSSADRSWDPVDLVAALRARRGRIENAIGRPLADGSRDIFLHPNTSWARPAQAVVPIELPPRSCFASTLVIASHRGDGVIFEVELASGSEARTVLHEILRPDEPPRDVRERFPEHWWGRRADLCLRTRPGPTNNYDWASFGSPRIVHCGG